MSGIIVIGAGQAGASLIIKLKKMGYKGSITLIGDEEGYSLSTPSFIKRISLRRNVFGSIIFKATKIL